jgi:hypothetical protein
VTASATLLRHRPTHFDDVDEVEAGERFTDEELTALALAADPDQPLDPDAVPFTGSDAVFPELLPAWYMPVPVARVRNRWHIVVVLLIVVAFGLINGLGLCITYGQISS